ncbi:MAG: alanine racemase [Bacteroidetes bacterium]|jgi:alanine racemase|nr:alanine racemase [Bacteroidota bacterium]
MNMHASYYQSILINEVVFLQNVQILKDYYQKPLGVVVKGGAYGHGLLTASRLFVKAGIQRLICYHLSDAQGLREAFPNISILLIGPIEMSDVEACRRNNIEITIWDYSFLEKVQQYAEKAPIDIPNLKIHIELETGMNRTGIKPNCIYSNLNRIFSKNRTDVIGFSTHISGADEKDNLDRVKKQIKNFGSFKVTIEKLRPRTFQDLEWHGPNSAALILRPKVFTHARLGILAYGFFPSSFSRSQWPKSFPSPRPSIQWQSRVAGSQVVPANQYTGYGKTHKTSRVTRTLMLPTGYGDGFPRALSNNWKVNIDGHLCPIIGRVNMNLIIVDVSELNKISHDSQVTLIQAKGDFDWYRAAEKSNHFIYELLTRISPKIPRLVKIEKGPSEN